MSKGSVWIKRSLELGSVPSFPSLTSTIQQRHNDVCIIGGGIVGLSAALKLHEQGKKVCLLEAGRIGQGTTGNSTAKKKHGINVAREYGLMNEEAIQDMENVIRKYKIECDWGRAAHITFAESTEELALVREEFSVAQQSGLPVSFIESSGSLELPFPHVGGIRAENQAFFNAHAYCVGLAKLLSETGQLIFEQSHVRAVSHGAPPHVVTLSNGSEVRADHVIVATHLPILDRGGQFSVTEPHRSYCIAVTLADDHLLPKDMYISVNSQFTRSLRSGVLGGQNVLIVCGAGHKAGEFPNGDATSCYAQLEAFVRQFYPVVEVVASWSAHDYQPADGMPYIGFLHHGTRSMYTATGFNKWGLAAGHAAGSIIADLVAGRENRFAQTFDARRWDLTHSMKDMVSFQGFIVKHFVGDRVKDRTGAPDIEDLGLDCGGICKDHKHGIVAAYRDQQGTLHKYSSACTHLGCPVRWNNADKSFDCPCHGSRYDVTGQVVHGPCVLPLKPLE